MFVKKPKENSRPNASQTKQPTNTSGNSQNPSSKLKESKESKESTSDPFQFSSKEPNNNDQKNISSNAAGGFFIDPNLIESIKDSQKNNFEAKNNYESPGMPNIFGNQEPLTNTNSQKAKTDDFLGFEFSDHNKSDKPATNNNQQTQSNQNNGNMFASCKLNNK